MKTKTCLTRLAFPHRRNQASKMAPPTRPAQQGQRHQQPNNKVRCNINQVRCEWRDFFFWNTREKSLVEEEESKVVEKRKMKLFPIQE